MLFASLSLKTSKITDFVTVFILREIKAGSPELTNGQTYWMCDWLPYWRRTDGRTDWLISWLTEWPTAWRMDERTDWLTYQLVDWLKDTKTDGRPNWLAVSQSVRRRRRQTYGLTDWRRDWLTSWLTDWRTWLTTWWGQFNTRSLLTSGTLTF